MTPTSVVSLSCTEAGETSLYTALLGHAVGLPEGLEEQLPGHEEGERFLVDLHGPPVDSSLIQTVPLTDLPPDLQRGAFLYAADDAGQPRSYRVVRLDEQSAELDANPEHAGHRRQIEVHLLSVREATTEELAHGHAHGEGGHIH